MPGEVENIKKFMEMWEAVLASHLSEVNRMSTRKSWGLTRKSKLSPPSGFAALRQLHRTQKKSP